MTSTELRLITTDQYKLFRIYEDVVDQYDWSSSTNSDPENSDSLGKAVLRKARQLYNDVTLLSSEDEVVYLHRDSDEEVESTILQFELLLSRLSDPKSLRTMRASVVTVAHLDGVFKTKLPYDIWYMHNLESLSLKHNNLSWVPPQIVMFPKLKSLNLKENETMDYLSFPVTLRWCRQLTHLYLPAVESLSVVIKDMPTLQYLEMSSTGAHPVMLHRSEITYNRPHSPCTKSTPFPLYITCQNFVLSTLKDPHMLSQVPIMIMKELMSSVMRLRTCIACSKILHENCNKDILNFMLPTFFGYNNKLFKALVCDNDTCESKAHEWANAEYDKIRAEIDAEYEIMIERAKQDDAMISCRLHVTVNEDEDELHSTRGDGARSNTKQKRKRRSRLSKLKIFRCFQRNNFDNIQ